MLMLMQYHMTTSTLVTLQLTLTMRQSTQSQLDQLQDLSLLLSPCMYLLH